MSVEPFGRPDDGAEVDVVEISDEGMSARFLTWGAVLQDLRLTGHAHSLVLGLPDIASYLAHSRYFGATAGRCANRIAGGRVTIDGEEFRLDRNFRGRHSLHGGADGIGKRLWRLVDHDAGSVEFEIVLDDGHMGFPGRLTASALFRVLDGCVLDIRYRAETDRPTLSSRPVWNRSTPSSPTSLPSSRRPAQRSAIVCIRAPQPVSPRSCES